MSLQQLELQFQNLGFCLKICADFINYLPFFVSTEELQQFFRLNMCYQELYRKYEAIAQSMRVGLRLDRDKLTSEVGSFCQANDIASHVVAIILQRAFDAIKPEITVAVKDKKINISSNLAEIIHMCESLYSECRENIPPQIYAEKRQILERNISTFFGLVGGFNAAACKKLQLKDIFSKGLIKKALRDQFYSAKDLQHSIYSLSQAQTDFSLLCKGLKTTPISSDDNLPKEGYSDLAFLTHLLKPEHVCQALQNKLEILQYNHEQLQEKVSKLSHLNLVKLARLQRIIIAYEDWFKILQEQKPKIVEKDLTAAIFIQQLLTYEKKSLLTKLFQTQTLSRVIGTIEKTLPKLEEKTIAEIYQYFYDEKLSIQQKVKAIEVEIRSNQTYWQAALATAALGITRQPEYQLGQLTAALNVQFFDQFPSVPVIGEQLPPHILSKLYHSVGMSFLGISMLASSRFGYSYQLIAFINRILLAQVDVLIKLGSYGEKVTQLTCQPVLDGLKKIAPAQFASTIERLKESICFDELGIIEKERFIHWSAGLGIQVGMTLGHNVIPAVMGYTSGTFFAHSVGATIEYVGKLFDYNETTLTGLSVMSHFITYSYAYRYAYVWGMVYFAETEQMSLQQAFTTFGLNQSAQWPEIKAKYREWALSNHPDRCMARGGGEIECETATEKMTEINAAYQFLKKKYM